MIRDKVMYKIIVWIHPFFFCFFLLFGAKSLNLQAQEILTDKDATPGTKALYSYLFETQQNGKTLFGHHDALAYGHGWTDELGRSDVKEVTGSHPAVCSMDFGKIEHNNTRNINGIPFEKMREIIRYAHKRGQVIMMCWHVDNPKTYTPGSRYPAGTSWDNSDTTVVREILQEGSSLNVRFKGWLDHLAEYIQTLTDEEGHPIPFIFRPWHEHTQGWNGEVNVRRMKNLSICGSLPYGI